MCTERFAFIWSTLKMLLFLLPQKRIKYTRKKKTSRKVDIINYLLSSSRDTTTDVQIVNFEFIMWALGGDAIRVA